MTDLTHEPDTQPGAVTNCCCSACRELRLQDDGRPTHTARDVAMAYAEGWRDGAKFRSQWLLPAKGGQSVMTEPFADKDGRVNWDAMRRAGITGMGGAELPTSAGAANVAWCAHALKHARSIGWQAGIDHYTERLAQAVSQARDDNRDCG